jgi:hypothetical protein
MSISRLKQSQRQVRISNCPTKTSDGNKACTTVPSYRKPMQEQASSADPFSSGAPLGVQVRLQSEDNSESGGRFNGILVSESPILRSFGCAWECSAEGMEIGRGLAFGVFIGVLRHTFKGSHYPRTPRLGSCTRTSPADVAVEWLYSGRGR